jgi:hypothetical protein
VITYVLVLSKIKVNLRTSKFLFKGKHYIKKDSILKGHNHSPGKLAWLKVG